MIKTKTKSRDEIAIMYEGGKLLAEVKNELKKATILGAAPFEIEKLATTLIQEKGGKPSFKMVKNYSWSTCINLNEGVVHGIPMSKTKFKDKDTVSVDVGLYFKGFHTDTSFTVVIGEDKKLSKFLEIGQQALNLAISQAKPGNKVGDISQAFQDELAKHNLEPIRALTGHGIGRQLHEEPLVPCYVAGSADEDVELKEGMTLAVEIMYTKGHHSIKLSEDGWTIVTKDGKIAALFEETIAITNGPPEVLTK